MKLKITLPENISEITLSQYQRYIKLTEREDLTEQGFDKRKVCIFTKIPFHDLDKVKQKDFKSINEQIDKALGEDCKFVTRFEMNGIEFGFIPNMNDMSTKEFVDTTLYPIDDMSTWHNLMAIFFRPVIKSDGLDNYDIETYKGTDEYKEMMKETPMNIVRGASIFFWTLQRALLKSTQRYTVEALKKGRKQRRFLISGDGYQPSRN